MADKLLQQAPRDERLRLAPTSCPRRRPSSSDRTCACATTPSRPPTLPSRWRVSSWSSDDYFTALVTQAIVGNYDKALGNAPHQGSKLSGFRAHQNDLANSFMSFSTSYSDTG